MHLADDAVALSDSAISSLGRLGTLGLPKGGEPS